MSDIDEVLGAVRMQPAATGSGEAKCPTCGDVATYQTPDGTLWDGNAHYWRVPPTVIRCDSCGGTLVYKRTDEGFLVYHACCGKYGRTPAPSPVTNVEETRVTSTDERARVESQPCGKWNKLHVMTLLTDVAQLLDGWHQDGTAWSEWDEEVRQRVSSYLRQVHTTPSEQFDTSVTALREENARLTKSLAAADAKRERDSLREFLESEIHNDKCDCLKCIRIRKALKAGKEPKL